MPRLRVLAGPSPSALVPITGLVNTGTPHTIASNLFQGQIAVFVKGLTDPEGHDVDSDYFARHDRKGITWSIQVQGRFLQSHSADDILFGNTFERPLNLPWGASAAFAFAKFIDPTLEHDLTSTTKPWALSPFISTMPHLVHQRISPSSSASSSRDSLFDYDNFNAQATPRAATFVHPKPPSTGTFGPFPPRQSIIDDTSQLHLALVEDISLSDLSASSSSSLSSVSSFHSSRSNFSQGSKKREKRIEKFLQKGNQLRNLQTGGERRSYFSAAKHRRQIRFGPEDLLTTDFCYGFLEFNPSLVLRLPAGVSFDLMKYWDGQPVRFVCCERKRSAVDGNESDSESLSESGEHGEPWGRVFWCLVIELAE